MGKVTVMGVEVPNPLQTLQEGIGGAVNWLVEAVKNLPAKIAEGIRDGLIKALDFAESIGGWISVGLDRLGEVVGRFLDDAVQKIGEKLVEVAKFLEPLTTRLGQFIDKLTSGIIDKLASGFQWLADRLMVAFQAFRPILEGIMVWVGQRLEAVIAALTPYLTRLGEWVYGGIKTAIDSVASWLREHRQEIASYIANAIKAVYDLIQPLILAFSELGQALIEQLQKAFNPEIEDLKTSYKQMFQALLDLQTETAKAVAGV